MASCTFNGILFKLHDLLLAFMSRFYILAASNLLSYIFVLQNQLVHLKPRHAALSCFVPALQTIEL